MVAHGDEQIKKHSSTILHFHLHCTAPLERAATADNQSEIMGSQTGIGLGSVLVGKTSTAQNGADLDTGLKTLLAESQALQSLEAEPLGCAIDGRVTENDIAETAMVDRHRFGVASASIRVRRFGGDGGFVSVFENPGVATLVVKQTRVVVPFVEELEAGRENFRLLVTE